VSGALTGRATSLDQVELLGILRKLEIAGTVTPISLELAEELTLDRFLDLATYFGALRNATAWWCADLLNLGDYLHGFTASQAEAVLGREPETLRRWQWVAERVPKSRRNPLLSFTHHEVVAALGPAEQVAWLNRAEEDRLTVAELRAHVKACSLTNTPRSDESAEAVASAVTSGVAATTRETGEQRACPTCGRPFDEQLQFVQGRATRRGEPGS
jgi:hypothetical protein